MNRAIKKQQSGFTLIELLLAMAFIALLLLAVAMTIIQIANIYNRGLILKELNQISRTIGDELEHGMRASSTFSLDPSAQRYVSNTAGGRLCLGQYSYIWNYGKAIKESNPELNKYVDDTVMTFAKVPDSGASYCVLNTTTGRYPAVNSAGAVEMMKTGDHNLAVHKLKIVSSTAATDELSGQQLYRVTYAIGTSDIDALSSDQSACKPPNVPGSDLTYCSVQEFTLVLRVVNGVN